jgi:NAD+ synthase (glutamine-hydrolysing)
MLKIKVAGTVLNQTPMDWSGNKNRIELALKKAREEKVSVLCLPELCITGYGCEDAFFYPHVQEAALNMLFEILPSTKDLFVTVGLPISHKGVLFNVAAVLVNGKLCGFIPKKSLAGDGVHYEPRWFKAWKADTVSEIELKGQKYPFGDLYFDVSGVKIGFEICEEAWVAHRPGANLARRAIDVILNPSASHFAFGKLETRSQFVCEGSRAFNVAYVYTNLLGNEAGRIIYDGGVLIADQGSLVASGPRFSFQDVLMTSATVDISRNRVARQRTYSYSADLTETNNLKVAVDFKLPLTTEVAKPTPSEAWEQSSQLKEEEFTRAVSLGLFDFLRKSRQAGFVISLSGGIDSSAVTILCKTAFELAARELGMEGLKQRLNYLPGIQKMKNLEEIAAAMIFCAYQGTQNSSETTERAAFEVAKDVGATFSSWKIDQILNGYEGLIEKSLHLSLNWKEHDIARQNIQARVRSPSIWMVANLRNSLLLATSNRSEAAVGYATMDGDTSGGLSPIGGIDKAFLKQWARWISSTGPNGVKAYKSFEFVFSKPPSAELRPQDQHQTDEDDLMPYEVLNQIEKLAIRDKASPKEVYITLNGLELGYESKKLLLWTLRFFRLWSRNQWKRERYAPAFHLDDESLDPKTWCRFPILSSGFEEELQSLEKEVNSR